MVKKSILRLRVAALILGGVGLALASGQVSAQAMWGQETPSAALARHMRQLASSPKDFNALIGAGRAALELGDTQSAIGFFGRADEVFPASPLPHAGMGAAMVADGDPTGALSHFAHAQRLGGNGAMLGLDRGLAYDLLGRHSDAQADYRAAMYGSDADEARRRLALSLAITGNKDEAIALLGPLVAKGDAGAARCRALVLAVSGDAEGARRLLDARMPGSGGQMAPFFAKLPSLRSDQKAAAVHLGIFPNSGQPAYAYAAPQQTYRPPQQAYASPSQPESSDRLVSIEQMLRAQTGVQSTASASAPVRMASVNRPQTRQVAATPGSAKERIWIQLASGSDASALPAQFKRMKSRYRDILEGISGYVAQDGARARLLIGPFKSSSDARILTEDLESVSVDAFSWTSPPGQPIRKLSTE